MTDLQQYYEIFKDVAIPLLSILAGWLWHSLKKMDERIWEMKGEMVTRDSLDQVKESVLGHVDARIDGVNGRLDQLIALLSNSIKIGP